MASRATSLPRLDGRQGGGSVVVGSDHRRANPNCLNDRVDLMMPVTQNGIGFAGPELTEEQRRQLAEDARRGSRESPRGAAPLGQ